jgi:hypothetical protein
MTAKNIISRIFAMILTLVLVWYILIPTNIARAANITVTTTSDGTSVSDCTLRDAITAADNDTATGGCPAGSGSDTIALATGETYILTIGELVIHSQITIEGNGSTIQRSSADDILDFRIFYLSPTGDLTLNELTVSNGRTVPGGGGGIKNWGALTMNQSTVSGNSGSGIVTLEGSSAYINHSYLSGNNGVGISNNRGSVVIEHSTISDNYGNDRGGGITNYRGSVDVYNSTISGNSVALEGGGIRNREGLLRLTNSTISSNSTEGVGGGIYNYNGTVELTNSIVAAQLSGSDCAGPVLSLGYNLDSDGTCNLNGTGDISGVDPHLGPLQNNGGSTWTHALLPNSPAINTIPTDNCAIATDQRGVSRPQGSGCDIGAFEFKVIVEGILNPANGHYYNLVVSQESPLNWYEAIVFAESLEFNGVSGHLATLISQQEEDFIISNFPQVYPQYVWLGASDEASEGDWKWITGETWDYTDWAIGEPNGETYENCLDFGDYSSQWNDERCSRKLYYFLVEYSTHPTFIEVDIKPGSDPNSINCNAVNEMITVAILTTEEFDATTVDHTTVTFEGASEIHVDKKTGGPQSHEEDVDKDGDVDLVFHFRLGDTNLTCESTEGTLTGETYESLPIIGTDTVWMTPQN